MRMTCLRSKTKIFPSPIFPVLADFSMASIAWSSNSSLIAASTFTFGRKSTTYSAPRYSSVWPFCLPKPLTSVTVMPCTPMAERASRTSSSLNGLMIAVTSFINELPEWVMDFERLELVDALQRGARHVLAGCAGGVGEHRVVRRVSAHFGARLEAVACEERDCCGHLLVLRVARRQRSRESWCGAEMEAVLVVERLAAQNPAKLRGEHVGDVQRCAVVLCLGGRAAGAGDILRDVEYFRADTQRIDDLVRHDGVDAGACAVRRSWSGQGHGFLARVTRDGYGQGLDRIERHSKLSGLAFVGIGELIPAVVDTGDEADRVAQSPSRAHAGVGEGNRSKQDGSRNVRVTRARDHLRSVQSGELAGDHGERASGVL